MISSSRITRILIKERAQFKLKKHGEGEFISGFIAGLSFAVAEIQELQKETSERMRDNPRYLHSLYQKEIKQ